MVGVKSNRRLLSAAQERGAMSELLAAILAPLLTAMADLAITLASAVVALFQRLLESIAILWSMLRSDRLSRPFKFVIGSAFVLLCFALGGLVGSCFRPTSTIPRKAVAAEAESGSARIELDVRVGSESPNGPAPRTFRLSVTGDDKLLTAPAPDGRDDPSQPRERIVERMKNAATRILRG